MKIIKKRSRIFTTGLKKQQIIKDVGIIKLNDNEMISFRTGKHKYHEITKKNWGFYATQSINYRLKKNFKTALVKNSQNRVFLMIIEKNKLKKFNRYCSEEKQKVIKWLDEIKVKR